MDNRCLIPSTPARGSNKEASEISLHGRFVAPTFWTQFPFTSAKVIRNRFLEVFWIAAVVDAVKDIQVPISWQVTRKNHQGVSFDPVPAPFVPFPPVAFRHIDTTFEEKSRALPAD
jgi:hypothetical protein